MPRYITSTSFKTASGDFDSEKDDREVNEILQDIQNNKGEILDIQVCLGGSTFTGVTALYVIEYEAPEPI